MSTFNVEKATRDCTQWIRDWFEKNGKGCNAVLGISGGKDSSVSAALCVAALGKERVFGVLLPQGEQSDISFSHGICEFLGIKNITVNIGKTVESVYGAIGNELELSSQTRFNLPSRIRMATLYAVSQSVNGRVCNTCNASEDYVGYSTRYGDSVGDFSPLSNFTVTEVKAIGRYLGVPSKYIDKVPTDGLCGKTDEDNLGFTYAMLDAYIRDGVLPPSEIKQKIDRLHTINLFKLQLMPSFPYQPEKEV